MNQLVRNLWKYGLATMLLMASSVALASLEWVQIGHVSGDNVCGSLETGIGDSRQLRFHRYGKFMNGDSVNERIHLQRGSTVAVRLLGHGADVFASVREEISGVSASTPARGAIFISPMQMSGRLAMLRFGYGWALQLSSTTTQFSCSGQLGERVFR